MAKKKIEKADDEIMTKKAPAKESSDEESPTSEDSVIDPSIIEDGFSEEFSEYNDVDNF